eukprot:gb/GFBE01079846.1/.p1 GENE.gb/GFBE01079846.1/~~gb/GFBE01079846.1/.p1  ORF type:complete len:506 (+),score=87.70 gb/GFBE01079846.1/:1-1518(+)
MSQTSSVASATATSSVTSGSTTSKSSSTITKTTTSCTGTTSTSGSTVTGTTVTTVTGTTVTGTTVTGTTVTGTTVTGTTVTATTTVTSTTLTTVTTTNTYTYTVTTSGTTTKTVTATTTMTSTSMTSTATVTTTTSNDNPLFAYMCRDGVSQFFTVEVNGTERGFRAYVPENAGQSTPLWLIMHGTAKTVDQFLGYTGLEEFAKQKKIAFIAPQALGKPARFNVGLESLADPHKADDVAFVRAVLDKVLALSCIDPLRVHCTGWSNGARFCVRLASELSTRIASIAPVAGLRFPRPNNASRPIPILAFHGTADPINPWEGNGDPTYWKESVVSALNAWGTFNGCRSVEAGASDPPFAHMTGDVYVTKYDNGCRQNASVALVKMIGAGHIWPGAAVGAKDKWHCGNGAGNRDVDANLLIYDFFNRYRMPANHRKNIGTVVLDAADAEPELQAPALQSSRGMLATSLVCGAGLLLTVGFGVMRRKRHLFLETEDSDVEAESRTVLLI